MEFLYVDFLFRLFLLAGTLGIERNVCICVRVAKGREQAFGNSFLG